MIPSGARGVLVPQPRVRGVLRTRRRPGGGVGPAGLLGAPGGDAAGGRGRGWGVVEAWVWVKLGWGVGGELAFAPP